MNATLPQPNVLLFDIDGTLVRTDGGGRRAFEAAFGDVCGRPNACAGISFAGMTDKAIVRRALSAIGQGPDEALMQRVLEAYLRRLPEALPAGSVRVLPGVVSALETLAANPLCAVGLGTGNLCDGARVKLERAGIAGWFSFGGYGSDAENRAELLSIGADRGANRLARSVSECRVVVVGDTPLDVTAALAIGAECVGVGTSGFDPAELLRLGASHAFSDLSDPRALPALLGRG
jgi:phosphoglycolate phosphatase-like HAD superfamily hydrolase